jgi:hypothetical protein
MGSKYYKTYPDKLEHIHFHAEDWKLLTGLSNKLIAHFIRGAQHNLDPERPDADHQVGRYRTLDRGSAGVHERSLYTLFIDSLRRGNAYTLQKITAGYASQGLNPDGSPLLPKPDAQPDSPTEQHISPADAVESLEDYKRRFK